MDLKDSPQRIEWMEIKTPESISKKLNHRGYKWVSREGRVILVHRLVWEEQFGTIPKSRDIHHKDGNKQNNKLENLQLVTRWEHIEIHKWMRKSL